MIAKHDLSFNVNGFSKIMSFQVKRSTATQKGKLVCFYKQGTNSHSVISTDLSTDHNNFPLDCFHENSHINEKRLYIFYQQFGRYEIKQTKTSDSKCCEKMQVIAVQNVTKLGASGK